MPHVLSLFLDLNLVLIVHDSCWSGFWPQLCQCKPGTTPVNSEQSSHVFHYIITRLDQILLCYA